MISKQAVIVLYKKRGETPLECLEMFRKENLEYKDEKMTYVGRLDPLAEGLLLVLAGDQIKNKEKYLNLDKEYEVDILFGFSTDTYDLLGKIVDSGNFQNFLLGNILQNFVGKFVQKYPAYSSKFWNRARSGELDEDAIESKEVEIKSIELITQKTISKDNFEKYIKNSIALVSGDFRQKEILKIWEEELVKSSIIEFSIVSIKVVCTSGTYMRSLANSVGKKIGVPALTLNIKRTKVGQFSID